MEGFELSVWYYKASSLLWGSPALESINQLLTSGQSLGIHQAAMSLFIQLYKRSIEWQLLANEAMSVKGAFDRNYIAKLRQMKESIPVMIAEEMSLMAMQEDGFKRYCICRGNNTFLYIPYCISPCFYKLYMYFFNMNHFSICAGPSNGSFMIGCDMCDSWFHGYCVGVDASVGENIVKTNSQYICPKCATKNGLSYQYAHMMGKIVKTIEDDNEVDDDDAKYSAFMKQTWLSSLWPPGKLVGESYKTDQSATTSQADTSQNVISSATSSSVNPLSSSATQLLTAVSNTDQPHTETISGIGVDMNDQTVVESHNVKRQPEEILGGENDGLAGAKRLKQDF